MIRPLIAEDTARMAAIHKASFPSGWPAEEMQTHLDKDLCLGIGIPLSAFILVQTSPDQGDILTLACAPDARRQGYGRALLQAAEKALIEKKVATLFLDVSEINEAAIALYKSCEYQPIGRRPAYYRTATGRVAAITFSKSLLA